MNECDRLVKMKSTRNRRFAASLGLIVGAALVMVASAGQAQSSGRSANVLRALENEVRALVDAVAPAVVTVRCVPSSHNTGDGTPNASPRAMSVGSGLILDTLGRIMTTARVVAGADDFWIETDDGRLFRAVMLGANRDIAVLQTEARGLKPAEFGDALDLGIGSIVAAIGNSYGYTGGLSWGVINGFRPDGTIQLSMGVSAGSSGGALVDSRGRIIGIVKAKISEPFYIDPLHLPAIGEQPSIAIPGRRLELPTSSVSLAVPIGTALRAAAQLAETGRTVPAYVGVYVENLTGWKTVHFKTTDGVLVTDVVEHTPAHRYGLVRGDVITAIDRTHVMSVQHFRRIVAQATPGERLLLDLIRGGKPLKLAIEVGRADIPYLGESIRPAVASSSRAASGGNRRTSGNGTLRALTAPVRDSLRSRQSSGSDWEGRFQKMERTIDSLQTEILDLRRGSSP